TARTARLKLGRCSGSDTICGEQQGSTMERPNARHSATLTIMLLSDYGRGESPFSGAPRRKVPFAPRTDSPHALPPKESASVLSQLAQTGVMTINHWEAVKSCVNWRKHEISEYSTSVQSVFAFGSAREKISE